MARQERAVRTRRAILVAAAEVFDEVGYEAATISEILKRSGLTKGALYFHFASKEELAQGVLAEQVHALPDLPEGELMLQTAVDRALLLAYLLRRDTGDPIVRGSVRLTVEQGALRDGLDRRVPMQAWTEQTQVLFEQAQTAGEILPHVDLVGAAKTFVGAFTGVQVLSNIMTGRQDMTERVADLYRFLMTAIAVPGVLVRLDFSPDRGVRAYEEAVRRRDAAPSPPPTDLRSPASRRRPRAAARISLVHPRAAPAPFAPPVGGGPHTPLGPSAGPPAPGRACGHPPTPQPGSHALLAPPCSRRRPVVGPPWCGSGRFSSGPACSCSRTRPPAGCRSGSGNFRSWAGFSCRGGVCCRGCLPVLSRAGYVNGHVVVADQVGKTVRADARALCCSGSAPACSGTWCVPGSPR
ncbi:TetR/AcrR family transcriptional regulator [Streptomyces sp. Tu 2975]|nr:TetR/AcrR family transcriptional regulator [Streptomyces sp. Tu 2975]